MSRRKPLQPLIGITWVMLFLVGCGAPAAPPEPPTSTTRSPTAMPRFPTPIPPTVTPGTSTPEPTVTPAPYPTPDLTQRPQIWFAPLPPLIVSESRPYIGAEDFMRLFEPDAPWTKAAGRIHVFKLYGEWVGTDPWNVNASDEELQQVIADLNQRGIALAMEAGPLEATATCGQGIEGFGGGVSIGMRDARRIKASGGTLSFVALDEPFAFASLYDGPNACRWSAERVAQEVGSYIRGMKTIFPDLFVGDTEPLWHEVDVEDYKNWLSVFREVNGYDLAFFHLDVDFSRNDWPQAAMELESFARGQGIEFGIIYFGSPNAPSDEAWLTSAGERVKTYELVAGGQPDHVLFQSWHDHPDRTLPETEPYTFTWFINAYFEDKENLGVRTEGLGANVAFSKSVRASKSDQSQPQGAVDGDPDTYWGAGDFAPQWIEIDLGEPYTLAELRLLVGQSPGGDTSHQVLVKGPNSGDKFQTAHIFSGVTDDLQWLRLAFPEPLQEVRYVRIETISSPSWIAWREIEVIAAD